MLETGTALEGFTVAQEAPVVGVVAWQPMPPPMLEHHVHDRRPLVLAAHVDCDSLPAPGWLQGLR